MADDCECSTDLKIEGWVAVAVLFVFGYRIVRNNGRGHYFFVGQKCSQKSVNAVTISGRLLLDLKKIIIHELLRCNIFFSKQTLGLDFYFIGLSSFFVILIGRRAYTTCSKLVPILST